MTVAEIGRLLRARQLSCVELVRQTLSAIEKDDRCNSFITLTPEQALAEAAERDAELSRGFDRGPLHGCPLAYKDIIHTAGVRTTGASALFAGFVPQKDAAVVTRLKAAGAISVGKTNLHELAYGATSQSSHFGPVLNPLDLSRIPGGSSGGSASAVAGGFLPVALGTDTGGSIRIPASYCGIAGFKPTFEKVSRQGVMPLAFSLDHVGPLGGTVGDCSAVMTALTNDMGEEKPLPSCKNLHVCLPKNFFFDWVDQSVAAAVKNAAHLLERDGAIVEEERIPDLNEANLAARVIQLSETAAIYANHMDGSLFSRDVWSLIQQGKAVPAHHYVNAQRIRTLFRRAFDRLWERFDVMVAPTTPISAPLRDQITLEIEGREETARMASTRFTRAVAFLGEPAVSIPCGKTSNGMPVGLQMVAAPGRDAELLQVAKHVETLLAFQR